MSVIDISNDPAARTFPVGITSTFDSTGALVLRVDSNVIAEDDTLSITHVNLDEEDPAVVPISLTAPVSGWDIEAAHDLGEGTVTWQNQTWGETQGEIEVVVTATETTTSNQAQRTIYIKVKAEPNKPHR